LYRYILKYIAEARDMLARTSIWSAALALLLCVLAAPAPARTVTDATGRQVEVPDRIDRVFTAGQPAAVLLYTLAPQKMLGWSHVPGPLAQAFLQPRFAKLPELGPLIRDGKVSIAMLRSLRPDLILDYGSLAPSYVEQASRVQAETGIPYLLLDGRLERTAEIYRFLGPVLGTPARGQELAQAADRLLEMRRRAWRQPVAGPIKAYYLRGADGLTTAAYGSPVTDVLRLMALINVAGSSETADLIQVSLQQVIGWQPDVVFASNRDYLAALKGPGWSAVAAVQQERVYAAPRPPFGWIDEPPSVNRLVGLLWAGQMLYPDMYPESLRDEARDFYRRFYQVDPTNEQLDQLLR
jgi:iron complex transport system substrate-binding protein